MKTNRKFNLLHSLRRPFDAKALEEVNVKLATWALVVARKWNVPLGQVLGGTYPWREATIARAEMMQMIFSNVIWRLDNKTIILMVSETVPFGWQRLTKRLLAQLLGIGLNNLHTKRVIAPRLGQVWKDARGQHQWRKKNG